jgi:integrase/recombinase XerD
VKVEDAIAIYVEAARARHLSERSIEHDRLMLAHFADWCDTHGVADVREATEKTLIEYHRWLRKRKRSNGEIISVKYQNRHARLARQLFKLLAERNLILSDIGKNLPPLHDPKDLPRGIMNKDQVTRLLQQPHQTTPLGFRDRTILEVLYSTGLRGGELCRLTLYDLDHDDRTLRVILGKGRKDRVVPIGRVAHTYLVEYLKTVRPVLMGDKASSFVFVTAAGLPLRTSDLGRLVRQYRQKAGLPDTITTHSLRHTCATEMLKGGASIRHVQELLGHADIMTTQVYTHVVPTDLQKAHARTAPSERRKAAEPVAFVAGDGKPRWNDKRNAPLWEKLRKKRIAKTEAIS